MTNKQYIKLGNFTFNLTLINYMEFIEEKLIFKIGIGDVNKTFIFKDKNDFERIRSFVRLISADFNCEVDEIDEHVPKKEILN